MARSRRRLVLHRLHIVELLRNHRRGLGRPRQWTVINAHQWHRSQALSEQHRLPRTYPGQPVVLAERLSMAGQVEIHGQSG
jgi:hypothetical protein